MTDLAEKLVNREHILSFCISIYEETRKFIKRCDKGGRSVGNYRSAFNMSPDEFAKTFGTPRDELKDLIIDDLEDVRQIIFAINAVYRHLLQQSLDHNQLDVKNYTAKYDPYDECIIVDNPLRLTKLQFFDKIEETKSVNLGELPGFHSNGYFNVFFKKIRDVEKSI